MDMISDYAVIITTVGISDVLIAQYHVRRTKQGLAGRCGQGPSGLLICIEMSLAAVFSVSQSGRRAFNHELAGNDATVQFGNGNCAPTIIIILPKRQKIAVLSSGPAMNWEDPLLQNQEDRQQELHNDHSIFQSSGIIPSFGTPQIFFTREETQQRTRQRQQ